MPNDIIRTLAVKTSATASSATSYDLGSEAGKVLYTPNLASGATITSGTQTDVNTALNYLGESVSDILGDFAQVETSPATYTHSVGDFIVYNNKLYKVTSAISAGSNLIVGTNITQTTVASSLAETKEVTATTDSNGFFDTGLSSDNYGLLWVKNVYSNNSGTTAQDFTWFALSKGGTADHITMQFKDWSGAVVFKNQSLTVTFSVIRI